MPAPHEIIHQDIENTCAALSNALLPLAGSTLLVTGGSGFVCSYLLDTVAHLNDCGFPEPCRVISVDNLRTGVPQRVRHLVGRPDFRFVDHDVLLNLWRWARGCIGLFTAPELHRRRSIGGIRWKPST